MDVDQYVVGMQLLKDICVLVCIIHASNCDQKLVNYKYRARIDFFSMLQRLPVTARPRNRDLYLHITSFTLFKLIRHFDILFYYAETPRMA